MDPGLEKKAALVFGPGGAIATAPAGEQAALPVADHCLGRYGRPEEYGDVVAFLASERTSYVNGSIFRVDGGMINSI